MTRVQGATGRPPVDSIQRSLNIPMPQYKMIVELTEKGYYGTTDSETLRQMIAAELRRAAERGLV